MNNSRLKLLLAKYRHRELPTNYTPPTPKEKVTALLREHDDEKQEWKRELAGQEKQHDRLLAKVTSLAYLLDEAVSRFQEPLEEKGLKRTYRELRVLKDKLVQTLQEAGYTWRDPLGERFEGDLPELVSVDGWRYGPDYEHECVAHVREPIILRDEAPIREGSVIVGAPESEEQPVQVPSVEPTQDAQVPPEAAESGDEKPGVDESVVESQADNQ